MGEFYKKPAAAEIKEKEEMIENINDLKALFEIEEKRTQDTSDNLGEATQPYRIALEGDKQTIGDIEWIRDYIKDKRMHRMTISQKLTSMMDSISMLMGWDLRYIEYLHMHIENYKRLCRNAMALVEKRDEELAAFKDPMATEVTLPKEEIDKFKVMFIENVNAYIRLVRANDPMARLGVGRAFALCGKSRQKRQVAESLFDYMMEQSGLKGNDRGIGNTIGIGRDLSKEIKKISPFEAQPPGQSPENNSEKPL